MVKYTPIKIIIGVLLWLCFSCNTDKKEYTIISGTIKNIKAPLKLLASYGTSNSDETIEIKHDGTFRDTITTLGGRYTIFDGNNMIGFYINPNQQYVINYDVNTFKEKGIDLLGNDTLFNAYFTEKSRKRVFFDPTGNGKSETEHRKFLNKIKQQKLKLLKSSNLSEQLIDAEKNQIKYQYCVDLLLYLYYNEIKEPALASINDLNIDYNNDEHYKIDGTYNRLVNEHYSIKLQNNEKAVKLVDTSFSLHQNALKFYDSIIPNEFIKNDVIAQNALYHFKNSKNIKSFYDDFKIYYTGANEVFKNEMLDLYSSLSKLVTGTTSPKFFNYKNYNDGSNSLDDFKGKYLYINLWATWCGNCYGQMPALKKLVEKYKKENISFLSIAWQDVETEWRKVIKERKLSGVQLLANATDNSFFEKYGVYGIPRYILIDPEGNLINYNAPSPSDKELTKLLDVLLQ